MTTWLRRWKLTYDKLPSSLTFNFNLRRYNKAPAAFAVGSKFVRSGMPWPMIVTLVVGSFYNHTSHHDSQLNLGTSVPKITTKVFTRIIPQMC